ncbi:MAG TPA: hypothetical protein O0Y06_07230 [Methanocorpusculum sp.]|nr:hypothetical protein [Methanocorpusculum sp.]HJK80676.1 hypothetical protein [Methanocorpusculum sp.]
MSRGDTLPIIAVFAIAIGLGCILAFGLIQYGNSLPAPDTFSPEENASAERLPGLYIISHGTEIIPENSTAVLEIMEGIAEKSFQNYLSIPDVGNIRDCEKYGTVATMQYSTPVHLTWVDQGGIEPVTHIISTRKIIITIPGEPENIPSRVRDLQYHVIVYAADDTGIPGRPAILGLDRGLADEFLEQLGLGQQPKP